MKGIFLSYIKVKLKKQGRSRSVPTRCIEKQSSSALLVATQSELWLVFFKKGH